MRHIPGCLNRFVPSGIKGFVFAALIAAIVSSLAAIINSAATIFSIDLYKVYLNPSASEEKLVKTGRISSIIMVIFAALIASSAFRNRTGISVYSGVYRSCESGYYSDVRTWDILEKDNRQGRMGCSIDNSSCPPAAEMDISCNAFP